MATILRRGGTHAAHRRRLCRHGGGVLLRQGRCEFLGSLRGAADAQPQQPPSRPPDAKRILCVASCKGGVGKSSVALNLAAALALRGERVGVLDMDIYGPSLPSLLPMASSQQVMGTKEGLIIPFQWGRVLPYRLQLMSYGYLRPGEFAAIRGPIASGITQQMLTGIAWSNLDTLVIDMPPGTGDIHLTVSQTIPVDGAAMVTTPQQLALVDVEKGIRMFDKVGIPTVAVIENMSYLDCGSCGARQHIFGEGGGQRLAEQFGIRCFQKLPLDPDFNSASEEALMGPLVASREHTDRPIVQAMHEVAEGIDKELLAVAASRGRRPKATSAEEGAFICVTGGDAPPATLPAREVRLACRGTVPFDPASVPEDVRALKVESAGRYAVNVEWSDGRSSIYSFDTLRELAAQ